MGNARPRFNMPPAEIGHIVADIAGIPVIDDTNYLNVEAPTDTMFLVSGFAGFCKVRDRLGEFASTCRRLVYLCNDYTAPPPSQVNKVVRERDDIHLELWAQMDEGGMKGRTTDRYLLRRVEWTWLRDRPIRRVQDPIYPGLFYYGSLRPGRMKTFERYLGTDVEGPLWVSTTSRSESKWWDFNGRIRTVEPLERFEDFQSFERTIYITDDASLGHNHGIANRFFEAMSAGLPIVADPRTRELFEFYGIHDMVYAEDGNEAMRIKDPYLKRDRDWFGEVMDRINSLLNP